MSSNLPAVIEQSARELSIDLAKVNVLLPTQTFGQVLGEYDKVTLEVVVIDPRKDAGEVSPIGDKLSLGRVPLEKIASAVGIVWDPERTTIIESSETKSRAKATGALRKPNGEWIVLSEEKTVDLAAFEEEQALAIEEKAEKGNFEGEVTAWGTTRNGKKFPAAFTPWKTDSEKATVCDRAIRKAMLQYRKFKDERAMTGAKERVIRALLAIKSSYTEEELSKPFVFPRVTLDASKMLASPELRGAAMERMTGAVRSLFGGNAPESELRNVTPTAQIAALSPAADEPESFDELPEDEPPFADPRKPLREQLAAVVADSGKRDALSRRVDKATGKSALDLVAMAIEDESATKEQLEALLKRCDKALGGAA